MTNFEHTGSSGNFVNRRNKFAAKNEVVDVRTSKNDPNKYFLYNNKISLNPIATFQLNECKVIFLNSSSVEVGSNNAVSTLNDAVAATKQFHRL